MTLNSKVVALTALALCLNATPARCQSNGAPLTDAELQKECAQRGIDPCPTAKEMAAANAALQKAWAGSDPYHTSLRESMRTGSMPKAYLKAVGDPKPTAEAMRWHNGQVGNLDSWFTFLTGASKLAYCETQQSVAKGELTGSAASNRESAREWLRATLRGVASPLTTHQLDLMLDWIKGYCTDTDGNPDGCDCAQLTQKTQDWLNNQSPY
jgi:hypothetical protein